MTIKKCTKCLIEKSHSEFYKRKKGKDGLNSSCKKCDIERKIQYQKKNIEKTREYNRQFRQKNREKCNEYARRYRKENPEKVAKHQRKRYLKDHEKIKDYQKKYRKENPEKIKYLHDRYYENNFEKISKRKKEYNKEREDFFKNYRREYFSINKDKIYEQRKLRYQNDINFKLAGNIRRRLGEAIKSKKALKSGPSIELIGCSWNELRLHLERQFDDKMTWENYGRKGWHIDHIRPCKSFDLTDPEQQKLCFHYSNLQPLWEPDNLRKGSKWQNTT